MHACLQDCRRTTELGKVPELVGVLGIALEIFPRDQVLNPFLDHLVGFEANPSTNQSINHPTSQSTNKPVNQPTNQ